MPNPIECFRNITKYKPYVFTNIKVTDNSVVNIYKLIYCRIFLLKSWPEYKNKLTCQLMDKSIPPDKWWRIAKSVWSWNNVEISTLNQRYFSTLIKRWKMVVFMLNLGWILKYDSLLPHRALKFAYSLQTEVDEQVFKQYMDTTVKLGQVYWLEWVNQQLLALTILSFVKKCFIQTEIVTDLTTRNSEPKDPYGHNMTTQKLKRRGVCTQKILL
jgi:hypothetical protein